MIFVLHLRAFHFWMWFYPWWCFSMSIDVSRKKGWMWELSRDELPFCIVDWMRDVGGLWTLLKMFLTWKDWTRLFGVWAEWNLGYRTIYRRIGWCKKKASVNEWLGNRPVSCNLHFVRTWVRFPSEIIGKMADLIICLIFQRLSLTEQQNS